ncbi:MAG: undecaprenyl-diphosphatase UppP [Patescibacteria group bacterium]
MSIFQALVLGVVQGISEFLPISSSGHLILIPELFGWPDQGINFDVAVHLATLCAILYVFRVDVARTAKAFVGNVKSQDARLGWMIIIATIPAVVVGLVFGDQIESYFRDAKWVAINLIVWGVVLALADYVATMRARRAQSGIRMTWGAAISAGLAQAIALIPGTSRSGITISAGLFAGLDRVQAARFSFLLAIPATAGAIALTAAKAAANQTPIEVMPTVVGFTAALIAGIVSITWLLKIITKVSYTWFAIYRVLIALLIFVLV